VEEDGRGAGRIRLAHIPEATKAALHAFVQQAIEPGSVVHTDGLRAYRGLDGLGCMHEISVLQDEEKDAAAKLLPRIHLVASLLKRWLSVSVLIVGRKFGSKRPDTVKSFPNKL
jgi:transposase-like protein